MSARALPAHGLMSVLNGSPEYQESLTATSAGTVRNATAFVGGEVIMLQADQDFYVIAGDSDDTVTITNGVKVLADEKFVLILKDGDRTRSARQTHVCCRGVSATATVRVYKLL